MAAKTAYLSLSTNIKGITAPMQKPARNDGILKADDKYIYFIPNVYPSNQVKEYGFYWRGMQEGWRAPLSKWSLDGVLGLFSNIALDPSITAFLEKSTSQITFSDEIENSILFPFQKEAVNFLITSERAMLALSPGLGKSASAIFAANELRVESILVICPLTLVLNWKKEIKRWIGKDAEIWRGNISNWKEYDSWVITNYETVARNIDDIIYQKFDIVIVDESILIKNRKAKRTDALRKLARTVKYLWLLSGSPISRFIDDIWAQLNIINPKRFSSYWRFAEHYCELETTPWGTKIAANQAGAINRLQNDIKDIYFSRTQSEVLDIPDWIFDTIEVEMGKQQSKLYGQMESEFLAELQDGDYILAPNVLSQMTRLIQFASNPILLGGIDQGAKWDAVEELLQFEEKPAIVWTQYIETANRLFERLNGTYKTAILTGETKIQDRQNIVDDFQSGEIDVIIAHPAVGKFGLTLTAARTAIYLERSYNGDDYYQSLHRVKRIGTTKSPHVIHLLASRAGENNYTIDHVIDNVLRYRKDNSIAITSGMIRKYLGES